MGRTRPGGYAVIATTVGLATVLAGCGGSSKKAASTGRQASGGGAPVAATSTAGGGGGSGGGKVPSNPCVLSAAEASSVIGGEYATAKSSSSGICNYTPAATNTDAGKAQFFTLISSGSDSEWSSSESSLKEDAGGPTTMISGVGDRAEAGGSALIAQGNGFIVDVHGELVEHDGDWSTYEAVAKAVLAKL